MGHTKIAYVGTVGMTNSITDRYLGYRKSMMEHRVDVPKDYVIDDRDTKPGVWIWKILQISKRYADRVCL